MRNALKRKPRFWCCLLQQASRSCVQKKIKKLNSRLLFYAKGQVHQLPDWLSSCKKGTLKITSSMNAFPPCSNFSLKGGEWVILPPPCEPRTSLLKTQGFFYTIRHTSPPKLLLLPAQSPHWVHPTTRLHPESRWKGTAPGHRHTRKAKGRYLCAMLPWLSKPCQKHTKNQLHWITHHLKCYSRAVVRAEFRSDSFTTSKQGIDYPQMVWIMNTF